MKKLLHFYLFPLDEQDWEKCSVVFATKKGMVRKNKFIDVAKVVLENLEILVN